MEKRKVSPFVWTIFLIAVVVAIVAGVFCIRSLENDKAVASIERQLGEDSHPSVVNRVPYGPLFNDGDIDFTFKLGNGDRLTVTCHKKQGRIACPIIGRPDLFK